MFEKGQRVRVLSGPWKNQIGTIYEQFISSVAVLLDIKDFKGEDRAADSFDTNNVELLQVRKKYTHLSRAQEYYRPGVWKIYYKVAEYDYFYELKSLDGIIHRHEHPLDEIKFSGHDAEERSLEIFQLMQKENQDVTA